jgi:hypothetical protein
LKISTQLYTRYGYESIGGGWYRVNNTRWWSYIAYRDNSLGLIFHDFYSNGIGAMELANYSWNAEKDYTEQCDPEHAEICDGIDNDCDDLYYQLGSSIQKNWGSNIDESFNLTKDPFNCGSCGNICYYPNSYRSCVNGVCQFDGCFKNYYDFDNNINNGCECNKKDGCFCEITNNGDEICDGIDNNCNDEVDEGLDCSIDNPTPPEDSSSSGGGGGGGGGSYTTTPSNYTNFSSYSFCNENWICGDFGECINGKQRRECYDSNECNTEKNLPEIVRECLVVKDNASERPFRMAMNENILIKSKGIIIPLLSGIIIILIIIISFIFIRESKRKKEIFEQRKKQRALIFVKAKYLVEEFKKRGYNEEYIKDKFREKGWLESDIEKIIGGVK